MALINFQFMSLEGMKFYCSFVGEGEEEACDAEATHFGSATDDFIEDGGRICETITFSCDAHAGPIRAEEQPAIDQGILTVGASSVWVPPTDTSFGFRQSHPYGRG